MIENLKIWIKESGLLKKKVAEKLGCSNVHLSYILNGKKKPSISLENRIKNLIK